MDLVCIFIQTSRDRHTFKISDKQCARVIGNEENLCVFFFLDSTVSLKILRTSAINHILKSIV